MDFIYAIEEKLKKVAKKNYLPLQAGDVVATYANVDDLVRDLDYKPETSIKKGISDFIDWYLDFFNIK